MPASARAATVRCHAPPRHPARRHPGPSQARTSGRGATRCPAGVPWRHGVTSAATGLGARSWSTRTVGGGRRRAPGCDRAGRRRHRCHHWEWPADDLCDLLCDRLCAGGRARPGAGPAGHPVHAAVSVVFGGDDTGATRPSLWNHLLAVVSTLITGAPVLLLATGVVVLVTLVRGTSRRY